MHNLNVDAALARSAVSGGLDRKVPEARQARWLSELERAAFASSGRQGDAAHAESQAGEDAASAFDGAPSRATGVQPAHAPTIQADAATGAVLRDSHCAAVVAAATQAPSAAPAVRTLAGRAAALAGAAPLHALAPADSAPRPFVASAALDAGAPAPEATQAPEVQEHDERAQGGGAGDGMPTPALQEAYAQRAMHVYRGGDGVQAWIRDAALQPQQADVVRRALADALGSAGEKLLSVTINGKKFSASPQAPSSEPGSDHASVYPHTTLSNQGEQ